MSNFEGKNLVSGQHFYQPPREATHKNLSNLHSDPEGRDWNSIIAKECYIPQIRRGTLDHASFDFYATTRRKIKDFAPTEWAKLKEAMRKRGVGDSFLHVLIPDLSKRDKRILIKAGYNAFTKDAGIEPQWFWAPETALDNNSLEVLAEVGYQGVLCAPEQLSSSGRDIDNRPVRISLESGHTILVLPFDKPFSQSLAFDKKDNADTYTRDIIIPRISNLPKSIPLIGWTDGETFGHHHKCADEFLNYLLTESLPNFGIAVLGLNDIQNIWQASDYGQGKLIERTAWSCPHGNLARWNGVCPCDGGYNGGWKSHFASAFRGLNNQIDAVLDKELGASWADSLVDNFSQAFYYQGSANSELSLLAAKASALGAQISCGTFFSNPNTSGRINVMFARQAIENLRDANYKNLADKLGLELRVKLAQGMDPFTGKNLTELYSDLLYEE